MEETTPALAEVEKNLKSAMVDKEQTPLFEEDLTETKPVYPEFTLIIRDLERKKDVEKAREVLSDPKFEFNLEDIESQIQKGHITISSLSEAQGTLIVQKLKDTDLKKECRTLIAKYSKMINDAIAGDKEEDKLAEVV